MKKNILLFIIGGSVYYLIETVYRMLTNKSDTHWAMFVVGGIAFLLVGCLNEGSLRRSSIVKQIIEGTIIVLLLEFVSGCVLNLWLGLHIWDYSNMPLNILGQICAPFAAIWSLLVGLAIVVDDLARFFIFGEPIPKYKLI